MEIYYREDELINLINALDDLIDDSDYYKEFNEILNEIIYQAKEKLEILQQQISKIEKEELEEQNREFEKSRI